jgi:hypothetical protein
VLDLFQVDETLYLNGDSKGLVSFV